MLFNHTSWYAYMLVSLCSTKYQKEPAVEFSSKLFVFFTISIHCDCFMIIFCAHDSGKTTEQGRLPLCYPGI